MALASNASPFDTSCAMAREAPVDLRNLIANRNLRKSKECEECEAVHLMWNFEDFEDGK